MQGESVGIEIMPYWKHRIQRQRRLNLEYRKVLSFENAPGRPYPIIVIVLFGPQDTWSTSHEQRAKSPLVK